MDINIISALIGALIGGIFTSGTTWWVFRKNRKALIIGVLQGIHAETETLWSIYKIKFKEVHEALTGGKFPKNYYIKKKYPLELHDKYFVVYDSNCARIGQIPDAKLRGDIVTGYLRARELLDAYLHNNELLRDLEYLRSQQSRVTHNEYDKDVESLEETLRELARYISDVHVEVKNFYDNVGKYIEKHFPEKR